LAAIKKAENAKTVSGLAYSKSQGGYEESSIKLWKGLLGDYFPSYG
jgi:hypothetical protein